MKRHTLEMKTATSSSTTNSTAISNSQGTIAAQMSDPAAAKDATHSFFCTVEVGRRMFPPPPGAPPPANSPVAKATSASLLHIAIRKRWNRLVFICSKAGEMAVMPVSGAGAVAISRVKARAFGRTP